jgi:hypothetical protein
MLSLFWRDSITRCRLFMELGPVQYIESGSICCMEPIPKKMIINQGFASNLFNLKIKSQKLTLNLFWQCFCIVQL